MDEYQPLMIALADAARNCAVHGATATLMLKGGQSVTGRLKGPPSPRAQSVHVRTSDGGWATVLVSEVAGVSATPPTGPRAGHNL